MAHLLFHVNNGSPALDQQRPERVAEIMEPDLPDAGRRQNRDKISMIKIVGIKNLSVG